MKPIFLKIINYTFWVIAFILISLIIYNQYLINNFFELYESYGIDFFTIVYDLRVKNLIISIFILTFSILATIKIIHWTIDKFPTFNTFKKALLTISLYAVTTLILASIHSINYYGNRNSFYEIDKNILAVEMKKDSLMLESAIKHNYKKLKIIGTIELIINQQKTYSYSIKKSNRFFSNKSEIKKNGYLRYDFDTKNELLKVYFRVFDINRSLRFDYNDESFFWTLPFDIKGFEIKNKNDSLIQNSFNFYNELQYLPKKENIAREKFLEIIELIKTDRLLTIDRLRMNFGVLRKYKINWNIFIEDTFFKAVRFDQSYVKGFDLFSRNLLFIQSLLLLIPISGFIVFMNNFLNEKKLIDFEIANKLDNEKTKYIKSKSNKKKK